MASIQVTADLDNDDFRTYDGDVDHTAVRALMAQISEKVDAYVLSSPEVRPRMVTFSLRDRNGNTVGELTLQD